MRSVTLPALPPIVDTIGHISLPWPGTVKSAFHLGVSGTSLRGHPGPSWENASMCPSPAADDPSSAPYQPYRSDAVLVEHDGPVTVVTINRPERRNAVDSLCADQLREAFVAFDRDDDRAVAVLTGTGATFCAGADLKAVAEGDRRPIPDDGPGPMGPTRLTLGKPVIAAIEGYAVAGGIELALWCDLRIAAEDAIFGVFCRRFGVPLCDLGTVRLPRIIGHGRAMDLILTGRAVAAPEALTLGLANRVVAGGAALPSALALAHQLAALPQVCLRSDRMSALEQWGLSEEEAAIGEARRGRAVVSSGETIEGALRFAGGAGRRGTALD
jgi:enoyl-CoA hydratase